MKPQLFALAPVAGFKERLVMDLYPSTATDVQDPLLALLQGVPRSLNRDPLGLHADNLPFHGADIWTLYELSWLNGKGLPQVAVGHVELPDTSANLVESKSFKLYLNSFNQTRFASWQDVAETLTRDLSACAQGGAKFAVSGAYAKHYERIIDGGGPEG